MRKALQAQYQTDSLAPGEIVNLFCKREESEDGLQESGIGFLGCDMTIFFSGLVLEWSDGPEKGIVVFGLPCALQKYIALGQNPVGCLATA
jgi:hypothetical protein